MPPELPQPGTSTEMYLAAILDELRAQRAAGARPEPARSYLIDLKEPERPAKPARRKG